jgi:hypothetical protein
MLAAMPPAEVAKKNLDAELILIGEVARIGKVILPNEGSRKKPPEDSPIRGVFVCKVLRVVKGFGKVSRGDEIKILYRLAPKGKIGASPELTGGPLVKVEPRNLVLIYIDPSNERGFYEPVFAGSSVLKIERSDPKNVSVDEKK